MEKSWKNVDIVIGPGLQSILLLNSISAIWMGDWKATAAERSGSSGHGLTRGHPCRRQPDKFITERYPLVNIQKATENGDF